VVNHITRISSQLQRRVEDYFIDAIAYGTATARWTWVPGQPQTLERVDAPGDSPDRGRAGALGDRVEAASASPDLSRETLEALVRQVETLGTGPDPMAEEWWLGQFR
jgi:hypothetical protein